MSFRETASIRVFGGDGEADRSRLATGFGGGGFGGFSGSGKSGGGVGSGSSLVCTRDVDHHPRARVPDCLGDVSVAVVDAGGLEGGW